MLLIIGRDNTTGEACAFQLYGALKKDLTTTQIIGSVGKTILGKDTAAFDVSITADDVNDSLKLEVTAATTNTTKWAAEVQYTEVKLLMAITLDNQDNKVCWSIILKWQTVPDYYPSVSVQVTPHGTITATDLQRALEQLADQDFRSDSEPTVNVEEGDTWYDTEDNQLKVYRETSTGVFEWVPIMVGNISEDSDTLDAGAF